MKDSGLNAIGLIPENWIILKFNSVITRLSTGLNPRDNFKLGFGQNYYVTIKNYKNGKVYLDDKCDMVTDEALKIINIRSDLKKNDILFASISSEPNIYMIEETPLNWNINESIFTIRVNEKIITPLFAKYVMQSTYFYNNLLVEATGSTFSSIKQKSLRANNIVLPSLAEQSKIVRYLHFKYTLVDQTIEKQKLLIEKLKAYKQSIITEAVTKGLDPNVTMKESGIEWIGEIPEHWEIKKIKYILSGKGIKIGPFGSALTSSEIHAKGDIKVYGQANLIRNDFSYGEKYINLDKFSELQVYEIFPNDILISMMGTIGKCSIFPNSAERGIMDSHLTKITFDNNVINTNYFKIFFSETSIIEKYLEKISIGSIMNGLNSTILKNIVITLPPIEEQDFIVSELFGKCTKIENTIEKTKMIIEKLESYKKSLIYECITGKREVK